MVDLIYEARDWDLETGWPYREAYEKYGLKDVADEMEKLGYLPKRPAQRWARLWRAARYPVCGNTAGRRPGHKLYQ